MKFSVTGEDTHMNVLESPPSRPRSDSEQTEFDFIKDHPTPQTALAASEAQKKKLELHVAALLYTMTNEIPKTNPL